MEMISTFLTKRFIQRGIIEPEQQDIYKTGLELIIADVINILLILMLGFITKSFIYACIYLIMFWTVRRFSGGFHAKTYAVCRIVFIGTYISMICISAVLHRWLLVSGVCNLIAFATMYLFAPIPHPNKELNSKEKKANKLFAMITTLFCILISIILVLLGYKEGLIISLTLLAITILMYVGMLTNAKGEVTMKRMINIKRIMGFGVLLSMIITALIPNHVFAANELQLGEYISLGSYNGNELIWRYVGSDENGKLMLSDKMVCYKAFDAAGEHRNSAKSRSSYGSNLWSESNIRCWLNSETEQVDFICGIEPSSENVWMGNYPYNSEHGFLNGFNNDEKTAIKSVSLKTKLNDVDITLSDGEYTSVEMASNTDTTTKTNKYQATTDKIFLMDETQLKMVKDNFKDNYYAKCDGVIGNVSYAVSGSNTGEAYFLRSPNTYEKAADGVCNIRYTDGEIQFDNTMSAYMPCGIRPAFYLADNVDFIDGNGTKEDPFIVSNSGTETSVTQNDNKVLFVTNEDGNIRLYIGNGDKEIVFTDAKPFIDENDRTLIPIRAISESLGYSVDYDDKNRVVTITGDNRIIKLTIGDRNLTVNNEVTEMDTAAQIVNDRTYIPVRFVAEALGYEVNYSATITGWTINENGEIVLNTENGTYDDIKDKH